MKLGQWVEFDSIIVRESTAQGSCVRTNSLPKPKRGMIIGVRPVYDAQGTFPPTLSNRRDVLLVATSLHTSYRVFPGDATLVSGVKVTLAQSNSKEDSQDVLSDDDEDDLHDGRRSAATDAEIALWVADAINAKIAQQAWFTAYDITCAVRDSHPYDEIPHTKVREFVHENMQPILTSNLYEAEAAQFGQDSAIRYIPA